MCRVLCGGMEGEDWCSVRLQTEAALTHRALAAHAPLRHQHRSGPAQSTSVYEYLSTILSNVKTDNHFKEADCDLGEETQEQFYRHRTN